MSKGEIIGHIADGKYRVRQKLAVEKIKEELIELNARIAELAVELPTAKLELLPWNLRLLQEAVDDINCKEEGLHLELVLPVHIDKPID